RIGVTGNLVDIDVLGVEAEVAGGGVIHLDVVVTGDLVVHAHPAGVDVGGGVVAANVGHIAVIGDLVELDHAIVVDIGGVVLDIDAVVSDLASVVITQGPDELDPTIGGVIPVVV